MLTAMANDDLSSFLINTEVDYEFAGIARVSYAIPFDMRGNVNLSSLESALSQAPAFSVGIRVKKAFATIHRGRNGGIRAPIYVLRRER